MSKVLDPKLFAKLQQIDSPTVSNAIEHFRVRSRVEGFAGYDLRCIYPELGTMMGYAVTCTADSTTIEREDDGGLFHLWELMEKSPKPSVLVIQSIGPDRKRSCHLGEVMATTARALGAVGCVSDGGLRDIVEIQQMGGFQLFCPGFVVSHGNPIICDIGVDVEVSGLKIKTGDLLHGDINGLLKIPIGIAPEIPAQVDEVRRREHEIMDFVQSSRFSVKRLKELQETFHH